MDDFCEIILENVTDTVVILNSDGTVRYKSPSFDAMVGMERTGDSPFSSVHPDDMQKAADAFAHLVENPGSKIETEIRGQHRDGSWRVFKVTAKNLIDEPVISGIIASFRDITEQHDAEKALRASEHRMKQYLEFSPDAIYVNDLEGRFVYGNRAAEEMIGYSKDELIGKSFLDLNILSPESLAMAAKNLLRNIAGEPTGPDEYGLIRKDGSIIPAEISAFTIGEDKATEFVGIARDITKRKIAEMDALEYMRQLEVLSRISATLTHSLDLGELLNNVLEEILHAVNLKVGGIFLLDKASGRIVIRAHHGLPKAFIRLVGQMGPGETCISDVFQSTTPLIVENTYSDNGLVPAALSKSHIRSFIAVPLVSQDSVIGVIMCCSRKFRRFSEQEVQFLRTIAAQIGMAIENAQLYEHTYELAFRDGLTNLYNRRYLLEQIEPELARAKRHGGQVSIIMLDLDGLKTINDHFGHREGDIFIKSLANIIQTQTRASDIAARWGGDEYLILAPAIESASAYKIAERIRTKLEKYTQVISGQQVSTSVSIGIASYPLHASDANELIQRADEAMYSAKRDGKNQVKIAAERKCEAII